MFKFLRFWRYHRYPSQHWGEDIAAILRRLPVGDATIIDAPSGDGIVSYWVIRQGVGKRYELYDLSDSAIAKAQRLHEWQRAQGVQLQIERRDIFDIPADSATHDVWLLINSLYLLPEIDRLLEHMRPRIATIVGIFPRTSSQNYQRWLARSPHTNINEMSEEGTIEFFARHRYQLRERRDFCYIPLMHLKSKYVRLAAMYLVNPFENLFPRREACYWLGVFSRADELPQPTSARGT